MMSVEGRPRSSRLYLSLHLNRRELLCLLIDDHWKIIAEDSFEHRATEDASVFALLESIDALFQKLRDQQTFDFADIVGISGCAEMGLVYWKTDEGLEWLKTLHSHVDHPVETSDVHHLPKNLFLIDLLKSSFSRLDYSAVDAQRLRNEFENADRVQCLSTFLGSVLLGAYAPIDVSDASQMNFIDLNEQKWLDDYAKFFGPTFVHPRTIVGTIAEYFLDRYGFNANCRLVSLTNEFSSSYYALASNVKTVVINLGETDTVMASIPASVAAKESTDGQLMINPLIVNEQSDLLLVLLQFRNGSAVRERVREEVASKDWQQLSELLCQSPPSNHGFVGFFFDHEEILPAHLQGRLYFNAAEQHVDQLDVSCKARALLEGQCLAKRLYLQRANIDLVHNVDQIVISGGDSVNADLLQIMADIFGKPVYAALAPHSSCLGGCFRLKDAMENNRSMSRTSTVESLLSAHPRNEYISVYDEMLVRYAKLEEILINRVQ